MRRIAIFAALSIYFGAPELLYPAAAQSVQVSRVKDFARFQGVRYNSLVGYGLVVGLPGTGDDNLAYTMQSMRSAASALGIQLPPGVNPALKNAAAVMITAELPPFSKPGQRVDVTVSALGRAKSLRGGTLLLAPLRGVDGATYAIAQGNLSVGGFGAEGADGSRIVVNTPTSGRIPGGATVEREVSSPFSTPGVLVLDLVTPSFSTAQLVAERLNTELGPIARAIDAVSIEIAAPEAVRDRVALAARIEAMQVSPSAPPSRVVVNARTGTVVINGDVRVLPAAISHGNLILTISEDIQVFQPNAFSGRGDTAVTPRSTVEARQDNARMALFAPGARLADIVEAVNKLGAAPGDLVAILEALKEAGSLRAELVVI